MKIKSKIGDGLFIGLVVFTILTLAMYVVWVVTGVWWPAIVLTAILLIVIVPIYFATYYELTRTELRIYCGIFGKSVPYRSIISMTDAESIAPAFCLSHQRILIRYMEDDEIKSVYVSPANREQFRELVNAEINKSTEIYKNVPKTSMDKAIEKARAEKIVMTRPELRAVEIEQENAAQESRQVVDHELKKLDDVIGENTSREATPEQRKKAEQKLLAKIRKLKVKKDEREKRNSYKESKVQARVAAAQPKPETAEEHRAMLEEEKAKIKAIAKSCEMDVSELLRELINKHLAGIKIPTLRPVRRKRQFGRLYKAYKELNRIGVNINQIARAINIMAKGGRSHESFPEILYEIMSISNRLDVILDVVLEEDEK